MFSSKITVNSNNELSSPPAFFHDEANHQGQGHEEDDDRRCHEDSAVSC